MSSSYQASKTYVKQPTSVPKPKTVLSTGTAKHFVPSKADCSKPGQTIGGKPGKGFSAQGTG